jgi:hypothetical protein
MNAKKKADLKAAALEVLAPLEAWAYQCHAASITLVQSGVLGPSRVARGSCKGVGGQHSWVVLGSDCYDGRADVVDPTLWSYDPNVTDLWCGGYRDGRHEPFGKGNIFRWGRPDEPSGPAMELTPRQPWSRKAVHFLDLLGPLDKKGWIQLAHAPVEGWPSAEIIDAICESGLDGYVPIDIKGMLTDRHAILYQRVP